MRSVLLPVVIVVVIVIVVVDDINERGRGGGDVKEPSIPCSEVRVADVCSLPAFDACLPFRHLWPCPLNRASSR